MLLSSTKPLPDIIVDQIENIVTQQQFPWYLVKETTFVDGPTPYEGAFNNSSFSHVLVMDYQPASQYYDVFESALRLISAAADQEFTDIVRVRLGCLLPDKLPHHCPHVDFEEEHTTALYYVNESDGDTIMFNACESIFQPDCQIRIAPERGKMIVFNGNVLHASSSPSTGYRIALNVNFKPRVS
jgi:hypothetical protein